ncbi:MAG TPA: phosphatidylserine/phosphatidylglycerophosphate/cardiolipin synthase family protein [Kofleriaceae bacterium]|nr:phosphatidylserine/phosphatidylglycerophosphate/cardiolipin synthase family protein [Kofleriaceae bacterium]
MRSSAVVVLGLALLVTGCTRTANQGGDDDAPGDAAPDAPGPGCFPTSPRSTSVEAFVAPTGLQSRITSLIDSAQTKLDIQMYLFTVSAIADRVIAAHQRGVDVRVILDPDHEGNLTTRTRLTSAGVPNRNAPALYSFSHAKYLLVDGKTALVMSANFNVDAMDSERNYGIVDRDADDFADLQAIFDQDWAGGGGEPPRPADLSCTRLIVAPNNARARLLDHIASATQTLDVEALYVSDDEIRSAIVAAKSRGVRVRVLIEGSSDDAGSTAVFKAAGIEVHYATSFYLHAKLIVADGVAFVGSQNFSFSGLDKNREVGALVFEPAAEAIIQQQFETDWSSTPAQ